MRKFALLSLLALMGCSTPKTETTLPNENCSNISSILVLRVMDNYVLGWVDDEVPYSALEKYEPTDEHFVFFLKEPNKVYYPKQRIQFDTPQCLVYNGSYNYQKTNTTDQTILIGKLEPNHIPNPEYLKLQNQKRIQDVEQVQAKLLKELGKKNKELAKKEQQLNQKEEKLNNREEYLRTSTWIERRAKQKALKMSQES